jgi:hypothetical protein
MQLSSLLQRLPLLYWCPCLLSGPQRVRHAELAPFSQRMLDDREPRAGHDVMTLDELWFYCSTDHELVWPRPDAKCPTGHALLLHAKTYCTPLSGMSEGCIS